MILGRTHGVVGEIVMLYVRYCTAELIKINSLLNLLDVEWSNQNARIREKTKSKQPNRKSTNKIQNKYKFCAGTANRGGNQISYAKTVRQLNLRVFPYSIWAHAPVNLHNLWWPPTNKYMGTADDRGSVILIVNNYFNLPSKRCRLRISVVFYAEPDTASPNCCRFHLWFFFRFKRTFQHEITQSPSVRTGDCVAPNADNSLCLKLNANLFTFATNSCMLRKKINHPPVNTNTEKRRKIEKRKIVFPAQNYNLKYYSNVMRTSVRRNRFTRNGSHIRKQKKTSVCAYSRKSMWSYCRAPQISCWNILLATEFSCDSHVSTHSPNRASSSNGIILPIWHMTSDDMHA